MTATRAGELPPLPPVAWPAIVTQGATPADFTPRGWTVEREARGDLNGDRIADMALILHMTDPANVLRKTGGLGQDQVDTNPRLLVVAFAAQGGGYRLVVANHELIPRLDDPVLADLIDDNSLSIADGRLRIAIGFFEEFGSWNRADYSYDFRYRRGRFELAAYETFIEARGSGLTSSLQVDYVRRIARRSEGEAVEGETRTQRVLAPRGAAPALDQIGDGRVFTPDLPTRGR